jgi:TetR/AcrR family transcriptional regulator, transcriptional repressor for nem operon
MLSAKGEATKNRIVQTAQRLFHLQGFFNTSMDDIIKKSGVKKGNLYFYFKSKDELGYAVLNRFTEDFMQHQQHFTHNAERPLKKIYGMLDGIEQNLREMNCRGGCPFGNFAIEMSDIHEGFRKQVETVFDAWTNQLQVVLDAAKQEGELKRSVDSRALAQLLVAAMEGATMLAKTKKDTKTFRNCARSLKALLEGAGV